MPVEFEFLRIFEDIKAKKHNFKLTHGPILNSGNTAEDLGKPAVHPHRRKEPVMILEQHIVVNDMRLLEILKKYDPDGGYTVTPEDFVHAVEVCQKKNERIIFLLRSVVLLPYSRVRSIFHAQLTVPKIASSVKHCLHFTLTLYVSIYNS